MPIYAYRCQDCGFEKDELQKMSDAPLTLCPSCGTQGFARKLTAPAFQLKGSGWYVTDFRDGGAGKKKPEGSAEGGAKDGADSASGPAQAESGTGASASGSAEGKAGESKPPAAKPAAEAPAAGKSGAAAPSPSSSGGAAA